MKEPPRDVAGQREGPGCGLVPPPMPRLPAGAPVLAEALPDPSTGIAMPREAETPVPLVEVKFDELFLNFFWSLPCFSD